MMQVQQYERVKAAWISEAARLAVNEEWGQVKELLRQLLTQDYGIFERFYLMVKQLEGRLNANEAVEAGDCPQGSTEGTCLWTPEQF